MKKYSGDVALKGNLDVLSDKPLDTRLVVLGKEDLYTLNRSFAYLGMPVSCIDEASIYILVDKSKIDNSEGWKKVSSGKNILVISQDKYDKLLTYDENTIYYTYEEDELDWGFGDEFPIILS